MESTRLDCTPMKKSSVFFSLHITLFRKQTNCSLPPYSTLFPSPMRSPAPSLHRLRSHSLHTDRAILGVLLTPQYPIPQQNVQLKSSVVTVLFFSNALASAFDLWSPLALTAHR